MEKISDVLKKKKIVFREPTFPTLKEFANQYMNYKLKMNWHHELFYEILDNTLTQIDGKICINDQKKINKNILMLAPRFHSKSQCFTITYPLWEIYRNPDIRIIIVSANEDIAISFNRAIVNNLENNAELIDTLGNLVPQSLDKKKWGEKAIIVKRDTMEKDPTIAAIGIGGKLISRRADIIICDDIIDLDTARTRQARNKTREWFENVLLPILEDNGRLIVAGTSWYKEDIYDTLWKDSQFDIRLKLKALIYNEKFISSTAGLRYLPYKLTEFPQAQNANEIFDTKVMRKYSLFHGLENGTLWPSKWSFEKLMDKKKNMSNSSFMRQYLNEPATEEERVFKESHLKRAQERGNAKTLIPMYDNIGKNTYNYGHLIIAIGVDLAISKKETADNSAIAVWGLDDKRNRILLWVDIGKFSPDEIKMKVVELYHNFRPAKIKVENIAFQEIIRQQLADDDIPVEGFHTTAGRKFNEETGIASMAMLFEQDKVIIPSAVAGHAEEHKRVKQLMYEFSSYTYDQHAGDALMASWFAFEALREFDKKLKENRGFFSTVSLVEHMRNTRMAHRVYLISGPPEYKYTFMHTSFVHIFRSVDHPNIPDHKKFLTPEEIFFIFATREEKSIAYIIQKQTGEIVGKIEGDMTSLFFANILEATAKFFNNAQLVINRVGEGEAIFLEMQKRFYPKLLCVQPDDDGRPIVKEGFKITDANLPIAVDYFKQLADSISIHIPDELVIKEMGELIGVEGNKLQTAFGSGQRLKTLAVALWIFNNWEDIEKKRAKNGNKKIVKKYPTLPYKVFNYS